MGYLYPVGQVTENPRVAGEPLGFSAESLDWVPKCFRKFNVTPETLRSADLFLEVQNEAIWTVRG